jgi:hypothetical protein
MLLLLLLLLLLLMANMWYCDVGKENKFIRYYVCEVGTDVGADQHEKSR